MPVLVGSSTISQNGMQRVYSTVHDTDDVDSIRAKSLKKQYNRYYYKRRNGRKSSRQPQQTIPDASDVLPDRLRALARSSSPSLDPTHRDGSQFDRFEAYMTALRRYFSLEEQLNQHPTGQECREQRNSLRRMARDVVNAYEMMARG